VKSEAEDIVITWKNGYDKGWVPKGRDRVDAYKDLIQTFLDQGYSREEIESKQVVTLVLHHSHNPHYKNKKNKKRWIEHCKQDFKLATLEVWPVEISKFDPSKVKFESAPKDSALAGLVPDYLDPSYQTDDIEEDEGDEYDESDEYDERPIVGPTNYSRFGWEIPQEDIDKKPKPIVEYSSDMLKLLGVDDE